MARIQDKERHASWLGQRERGSKPAMRLRAWTTLALGRRVGRWFLYPICAYFVAFSVRARRAFADYLRRVLGRPPAWREIFHRYHILAPTIHERGYLLAGKYRYFDVPLERRCGASCEALFPYLLSCYVSFGGFSSRGFLVGKPDSAGFAGDTAALQYSTATRTPPHHAG